MQYAPHLHGKLESKGRRRRNRGRGGEGGGREKEENKRKKEKRSKIGIARGEDPCEDPRGFFLNPRLEDFNPRLEDFSTKVEYFEIFFCLRSKILFQLLNWCRSFL